MVKLRTEKDEVITRLEYTQKDISDMKSTVNTMQKKIDTVTSDSDKQQNELLLAQVRNTREEMLKLKDYQQRNNLIVTGVPGKGREENCIDTVDDIFYSYLWLDVKNGIDKAHRMGAVHKGRNPRSIIVRFTKH